MSGYEEKGYDDIAHLLDGAEAPREGDKSDGGVDIKGKLSSVAACACEKGNKAVNTSDLVEHLRTSVSGAGRIGVVGSYCKENDNSGTSLEIE